jgi:CheY-like chemotaxis protein
MLGSLPERLNSTRSFLGKALLAVCAATLLTVALPSEVRAQGDEETKAKISKLYREGVDLFQMGRFEESKAKLQQVLALDPNAKEAYDLVRQCGERLMIQWMTEPKMGREPRILYDLYRLHASRLKRTPEFIKGLVSIATDPLKHPVKRWDAIHKLQDVGQFAIPFLVDALGDERDHEIRALARVTATKMGPQAVLPLIELLKMRSDDESAGEGSGPSRLVRENVVLILGDIEPPDERGLAALKRAAEDESESPVVRKYAMRSLQKITGLDAAGLPAAAQYFYRKADRYVREIPGVAAEASEADGVIWRLEKGKLVDYQVPRFAWNELMAEQACYECMKADLTFEDIYPLYAEAMASQIAEVKELKDIAVERPVGRPFSDEETAEVTARDEKLKGALLLINALGPAYVYRGIDKALDDATQDGRSLPKLAATVLCNAALELDPDGKLLPKSGGGKGKRGAETDVGASLVRALRFDDERVQYAAAIALARMNPPEPFDGASEVVDTLGRAVGEGGPMQVLVVEEDPSIRNEIVGKLRALEYGVSVAESAREGIARATGFPPFDVVIASPRLESAENIEWLLDQMIGEPRARSIPIAILTSYSKRAEDTERFKDKTNVRGFIPIEDEQRDLRQLVEKAASFRAFPVMSRQRAEEVSVAGAEALTAIDADLARINGMETEQCGEACLAALDNRSDAVRRPCIEALGKFRITKAHEKILSIAVDRNETLEIRKTAVKSVGSITPELSLDKILELARDEKEFILRELASIGYGHASASPEKVKEFLQELRLRLDDKHAINNE